MNKSKSYKHCMVIINANECDSYCIEIAIGIVASYSQVHASYTSRLAIASYVTSDVR